MLKKKRKKKEVLWIIKVIYKERDKYRKLISYFRLNYMVTKIDICKIKYNYKYYEVCPSKN